MMTNDPYFSLLHCFIVCYLLSGSSTISRLLSWLLMCISSGIDSTSEYYVTSNYHLHLTEKALLTTVF
jgi:hypothetical protein